MEQEAEDEDRTHAPNRQQERRRRRKARLVLSGIKDRIKIDSRNRD